ncbi:MAG: hypothetical protein J0I84_02725 [Terrimonas sp.]|nr:hypothetical protein [Terrimonas sp.]
MERKSKFKQILLLAFLLGYFANVQAQEQVPAKTEQPVWASVNQVPHFKITDTPAFPQKTLSAQSNEVRPMAYDVLEVGFSASGHGLCTPEYRFVATGTGGFHIGQTVYWDPGLTAPLTGTLIMNPADGKIHNLSGGVIGSFTGNYCN